MFNIAKCLALRKPAVCISSCMRPNWHGACKESCITPQYRDASCRSASSIHVMTQSRRNTITFTKPKFYLSNLMYQTNCLKQKLIDLHPAEAHLPLCIQARLTQTSSESREVNEAKSKNYIALYLISQISLLRVMCRLTKYSTIFCVLGVPICISSAFIGVMPTHTAQNLVSVLALYMLMFLGQSLLFSSRVIAKVQISEDQKHLKVSHLSLFGDRRDIYLKPSDTVPIAVPSGNLHEKHLFITQFRNVPKKFIFLPQQGGQDTNFEALEYLFIKGGKKD